MIVLCDIKGHFEVLVVDKFPQLVERILQLLKTKSLSHSIISRVCGASILRETLLPSTES